MIDEKMEKFKPIIEELIQYYYETYPSGGYCHIALDDGNLSDENLFFCQEKCENNEDLLGYLIATVLRHFSEKEREDLYDSDWWGMRRHKSSRK